MALLTGFAAMGAASCGDNALSPRQLSGMYVLESVAGSQLPAVYRQIPWHGDTVHVTTAYADTITFFGDGTGTWGGSRYTIALVSNGESKLLLDDVGNRGGFSYEIRHGVIYFQPDPPQEALPLAALYDPARLSFAPPEKPNFLSYIQHYYEATFQGSELAVDDVTPTYDAYTPARRSVYRRVH